MAVLWLIFALFVVWFSYKMSKFYRTVYPIPTPPGDLLVGCLCRFLANSDKMLETIHKYSSKHYPIYRMTSFFFTVVTLLDPKDIELILSSSKHITKSRIYDYVKSWLGTGLLVSTGEKWRVRRKILTPAFHYGILQEYVVVFNKSTATLVARMEEECDKSTTNIVPIVVNFTLKSIGETAMGLKDVSETEYEKYKEAVYQMGKIILRRISKLWFHVQAIYDLSSAGREEQGVVKTLHDFTNNIIFRREKENQNIVDDNTAKKRMAMLDLLLAARSAGANIDHEGIREEVDTFLFEGHDTTAMALSYTLLTLANLIEIQEKIVAEILEIVGPSTEPTIHQLQDLKYTERCIKECLRLFPSVPLISRRVQEDMWTTTGYLIPKRTIVHIPIFETHRNPVLYPDPLKFDPDRFLPENAKNRHPYAYIPFSAGPRNCIGQKYAILQLKAALCGILRKFVLEPVDTIYDIKFKPDFVLRSEGNELKIKIRPRA